MKYPELTVDSLKCSMSRKKCHYNRLVRRGCGERDLGFRAVTVFKQKYEKILLQKHSEKKSETVSSTTIIAVEKVVMSTLLHILQNRPSLTCNSADVFLESFI